MADLLLPIESLLWWIGLCGFILVALGLIQTGLLIWLCTTIEFCQVDGDGR